MFDPLHKWLGIPPSEQPPNDYRLLGLANFEDDPDVIDAAADRDLTFLHDLTNGEHGDLAEELSNRISAARIRLLNKKKKAEYDAELRAQAAEDEIDVDSVLDSLAATPETQSKPSGNAAEVLGVPPGVSQPTRPPGDKETVASANEPPAETRSPLQQQPVQQQPAQQVGGPQVSTSTGGSKRTRRKSSASLVWLLGVLPSVAVLGYLIFSIWTGRIQLDPDKLEQIGIPKEQAEQLAGEPNDTPPSESVADSDSAPSTSLQPQSPLTPSDRNRSNDRQPSERIAAMEPGGSSANATPGTASPETARPGTARPRVSVDTRPPSNASPSSTAPSNSTPPDGMTIPPIQRGATPSLAEYLTSSDKHPIPTPESIAAKLKTVRDIYYQDYVDAATAEEKIAVADQMRQTGIDTKNDPGGQFALYRVARDIFIREKDFGSALEIIDLIDESFEDVEVYRLKREVLEGVTDLKSGKNEYAEASIQFLEDCLRAGRLQDAWAISNKLYLESKRLPQSLSSRFNFLREQIGEAMWMFNQYEESALVLEKTPDDSHAQSVAGKYLCLVESRWDEGLPLLAEGSDTLYREAAQSELSGSAGGVSELEIADNWFNIINDTESGFVKRALADHTKAFYQSARVKTNGLEIRKIDQRLVVLNAFSTPGPLSNSRIRAEQREAAAKAKLDARSRALASKPKVLQTRTFNSSPVGDFANIRGNRIQIGMGERASFGEAAGGVEFENVGTVGVVGTASHPTMTTSSSSSKVGFFIDYHTPRGYSKRVFLNCSTNTPSSFMPSPPWGTARAPDDRDFLPVSRQYTIDLEKWAPPDWDGRSWFSVYMQNAGHNRTLTALLSWEARSDDMEAE